MKLTRQHKIIPTRNMARATFKNSLIEPMIRAQPGILKQMLIFYADKLPEAREYFWDVFDGTLEYFFYMDKEEFTWKKLTGELDHLEHIEWLDKTENQMNIFQITIHDTHPDKIMEDLAKILKRDILCWDGDEPNTIQFEVHDDERKMFHDA